MNLNSGDKHQADLLASVLDTSLDGIMAFSSMRDAQGNIVDFSIDFVNRKCEEIVGRTTDQLINNTLLEEFPGNKEDGLFNKYIQVVETGEPFYTEHHYAHDGLDHWFSIKAAKCADGFTVTFSDITATMKAREQLRHSNERFELLVAGNASGVWDWDCKTDRLYWSPRFKELIGYEDHEIDPVLDDFVSRLHPEDKDKTVEQLQGHIKQQGPYDVEYRLRHKAGHYVWCHAAGQAQWDEQGNPIRMAGSISEITDRKATEEENKMLSMIASRTDNGAIITDAQGKVQWINEGFVKLTGYSLDEMKGKTPGSVLQGPDTCPKAVERIRRNLELHNGFHETLINYHKNGQPYWIEIEVQPIRDGQGQITNFMAIERDVSERINHEAQLKAQQNRLEFALQASRTGLWDWHVESGGTYFSDTWYTMLGYEPGELPMKVQSWIDLTEPDDLKGAMAALEDYFQGKTDRYTSEIRVKNKAGEWQWMLDVGEAVERDQQGNVTRMVGLHVDIDEQKRTQFELAQARDLAEQANQAKSAFVANMSHEIRTPMNAILGFADLLLDTGQAEADKRSHAQTITRHGKHLMSILNDILDLSKIESGKFTTEAVAFEPGELFEDIIRLMRPKAENHGIALSYDASELPKHITSDPTRIRQVILNLVGNAIKFTEDGEVRLKASLSQGNDGKATLTCNVIDTGIGITDEQKKLLFKPFSQADESTTRRFGGTGLGLSISSSLCKMLGGTIDCESKPGQGSTFTATFVVQVDESEKKPTPSQNCDTCDTAVLAGKRILIVEDGIDNQRLLQHYFRKADARIELAENGEVGREKAIHAWQADDPFDMVLMDMQMPVLDGYEATAQLREAGYTRPIIALTAHASAHDRDKCLAAGCTDYLSKPADRQKLLQLVAMYVTPELRQGAAA